MTTATEHYHDAAVVALTKALEEYEREHPGAEWKLHRPGPASIRLRLIDKAFENMPKYRRHDLIWDFLAARVNREQVMPQISVLLLLAPAEVESSLMNARFDRP